MSPIQARDSSPRFVSLRIFYHKSACDLNSYNLDLLGSGSDRENLVSRGGDFLYFFKNKEKSLEAVTASRRPLKNMELLARIELATTSLRVKCSTIEPQQHFAKCVPASSALSFNVLAFSAPSFNALSFNALSFNALSFNVLSFNAPNDYTLCCSFIQIIILFLKGSFFDAESRGFAEIHGN